MTPDEQQEMASLRRAHQLMVAQFKVMQQEKEHGWREADKWEARVVKAWFEGYRAGAGRPAFPPDNPYYGGSE